MSPFPMLLGLAPWFVFSIVAERVGPDHVVLAAVAACLAAVVVAIVGEVRGTGSKILDLTGVALFGVIAVLGLVGDDGVDQLLTFFGRGGSAFILAAVMAISAFTVPFTASYARKSVDPSLWHSPIFRAKNRQISLLWAGAVALMGCAHTLAGALADHAVDGAHPGNLLLNWVVPIALIVFAIKRTNAIANAQPAAPSTTRAAA